MKIAKGQLLAITSGQYSDYCLEGHMRAARDFDSDEMMAEYRAGTTEKSEIKLASGFLAWAMRAGYMDVCPEGEVVEMWVDTDYGKTFTLDPKPVGVPWGAEQQSREESGQK